MNMKNNNFRNVLTTIIIILILGAVIIPGASINVVEKKDTNDYFINSLTNKMDQVSLDYGLIRNITENLSNIIFTEYNETNGEIAKGRAFGSKGEQRAAEILYENFTNFGFDPDRKYIDEEAVGVFLDRKIDILNYKLTIYHNSSKKNCTVFTLPRRSILGPHNRFWKLNYNFSYTNLKIRTSHPPRGESTEDYVIFQKDRDENSNVQSNGLFIAWMEKFLEFFMHRHWVGYIRADSNNDTCNMWIPGKLVPLFSINKTVGDTIDVENDRIHFYLEQRVNNSVNSSNVIAEIEGKKPNKTVIVCCLYDSWWCQGTGDSAVGMGTVMGIAKYFKDLQRICNITPKYTMKFIGFCGEELRCHGSKYYVRTHPFEKILYVIDLNQLGMDQTDPDPRLTLDVLANKKCFLKEVWDIVNRTNYKQRTNNWYNITPLYNPKGHLSDDRIFALNKPSCKTVCFLKSGKWKYHHRDGLNHEEGDVLSHIDWNDVNVTAEIVLNVTKYLVLDEHPEPIQNKNSIIDLFSPISNYLLKRKY